MSSFIIHFFFLFLLVSLNYSATLNIPHFIELWGYKCETHYIVTEDGYILTYHRIPHKINETASSKPLALLMHGLSSNSAEFITYDPTRSLGYLLADAGYDVWLANCRGTELSSNHTSINPYTNPEKFYDFSWHEIGNFDIPAAVDYILNITDQTSLHFIGLSQGSTSFFVFASMRPEYANRIKLASLLAPPTFLEHINDFLKNMVRIAIPAVKSLNIHNFPLHKLFQNLMATHCGASTTLLSVLCKPVFAAISFGSDYSPYNESIIGLSKTPDSFALKQVEHYGQLILSGGFKQFDYGFEENMKRYGNVTPPDYNISKITVPVAIYVGRNDYIVGYTNVQKLVTKLPNVVKFYIPPKKSFNHGDFVHSKNIGKLVYDDLIKFMKTYD